MWPWQSTPASSDLMGQNDAARTATNANPSGLSGLNELFRRENEQSRLVAEQRRALDELSRYQQSQQRELEMLAQERQNQQVEKYADQSATIQRQQMELEQLAEIRKRALELDADNRQLHTQLAQAQQQSRLMEDQANLLKQQLSDTAQRLATAVQGQQEADRKFQLAQQEANQRVSALQATLPRQGSATLRANSSLRQNLSAITIAGLNVRQDGDVIRIELPSDQIFATGSATLTGEAVAAIDAVAKAIQQNYPQQILGIEAHTDNASSPGGSWQSPHQLTAAQAMAIFDQLSERYQFDSRRMFVLGHGPNYPIASNATPGGQQRNRRVEVVVYPETVGQPR